MIDTNVLAHCANPEEPRSSAAIAFVSAIVNGTERICVDEGFSTVESQNRSVIGAEYLEHVHFGSPGHYLIQVLASRGRIRIVPKRPPSSISRAINQCIRKKRDRAFVGVAWHGADRVLVSHDFADFSISKRAHVKQRITVIVLDADECLLACK